MTESIVDQKVEALKASFRKIDPTKELDVEDNGGGKLVYGPFPSFIVLVQELGPMLALVHVNADAPNAVLFFQQFAKDGLELQFDGPFAVDSATGNLILGAESYAKKEENILMFAADIIQRRKASEQEGLVVPDKKIIIAQ